MHGRARGPRRGRRAFAIRMTRRPLRAVAARRRAPSPLSRSRPITRSRRPSCSAAMAHPMRARNRPYVRTSAPQQSRSRRHNHDTPCRLSAIWSTPSTSTLYSAAARPVLHRRRPTSSNVKGHARPTIASACLGCAVGLVLLTVRSFSLGPSLPRRWAPALFPPPPVPPPL